MEGVAAFEFALSECRDATENAEVINLGETGYQAAYAELSAERRRQALVAELLSEVCPKFLVDNV